jgi:hypothetical protein
MSIPGLSPEITELLDKYGAIGVATAPLGASVIARMVFGKSKMVSYFVRVSAGWLAARAFLAPHLDQMQKTLISLVDVIHSNGYN